MNKSFNLISFYELSHLTLKYYYYDFISLYLSLSLHSPINKRFTFFFLYLRFFLFLFQDSSLIKLQHTGCNAVSKSEYYIQSFFP